MSDKKLQTTPESSLKTPSFMQEALKEAMKASERFEVPVGAIIVHKNSIISRSSNEVFQKHDPTAHAEILAIQKASLKLCTEFLCECDMYVTLEPCAMCAQAISLARVRRLYFGAYDKKYGAIVHGCRVFEKAVHKTEMIGGICEAECGKILEIFFKKKRESKIQV